MRRALLLLAAFALSACTQTRSVSMTFGADGEGLDGFLCKDPSGKFLLDRLQQPDGGTSPTSLVVDFVRLGGVPGCRTGQLMKWCSTHDCVPMKTTRSCVQVGFPANPEMLPRETLRKLVLAALKIMGTTDVIADAPDEFVLVRVVGTAQGCDALLPDASGELPAFDKEQLVGCAYSCPVLFDKVEQDVYLGFETLTAQCEQGVRICSDGKLQWQP